MSHEHSADAATLSDMLRRALGMPEGATLPDIVRAMDERDGRVLAVDLEYQRHTVREVAEDPPGWMVRTDLGSIHLPNDREQRPPQPGEVMRLYGRGYGHDVRGVVIAERVYHYQSAADYEKHRLKPSVPTPVDDVTHRALALAFDRTVSSIAALRSQLDRGEVACRLERAEADMLVRGCETVARLTEAAGMCLDVRDAFVAGRGEGMRVRVADKRERVTEPSPWPAGQNADWAAGFRRGWHEADHYKRMQAAEDTLRKLAEAVSDLFTAGKAQVESREASVWMVPDEGPPNPNNPVLAARAKVEALLLRASATAPVSEAR
jgi:hypothetical protein